MFYDTELNIANCCKLNCFRYQITTENAIFFSVLCNKSNLFFGIVIS